LNSALLPCFSFVPLKSSKYIYNINQVYLELSEIKEIKLLLRKKRKLF
jgi:hypothetical protein